MKFQPKSYKTELRVVYLFGSYRNDMIAFIITAVIVVGLLGLAVGFQ